MVKIANEKGSFKKNIENYKNLLLKNCKIVSGDNVFLKQISIVEGKIESITSNDANIIVDEYTKVVDVGEKYVMPGVIDPHVHFREPGMEYKENFFTGGKAAVKGGVTTIFDMPNTKPPTIDLETLEKKRELAKKCVANWGLHFGASVDDNCEEIKKVKNVVSTKIFMNVSTGKMLVKDDKLLEKIFSCSKFVCVHAENEMVEKAIKINSTVGNGVYLCHISLASEIEVIKKAKEDEDLCNEKHPVYAEVTPHHLLLTENDADEYIVMKPELKSKRDQDRLWQAINEGIIDVIGTDHAPHTLEEKKEGYENGSLVFGVPGVETSLPLMLDAVNHKKLKFSKLIQLMCHNPAEIFGVKNKGYLRDGYDADLVIVDMDMIKEVTNSSIVSKCKWSPFNEFKLKGWPVMTIVNGKIVYENNNVDTNNLGKEVEFK